MSDTCAHFADIAERVQRGEESPYVSPNLAKGAERCATADDIRARRLYFSALTAFRSNLLDAADLGPGIRDVLEDFRRKVDELAPTSEALDAAMARRAKQ